MAPHLIIKYVDRYYPSYWDKCLTRVSLNALLEPWLDKEISATDYTRLRDHGAAPRALKTALSQADARARIEDVLGCAGLFTCATESEVDALLGPLAYGRSSPVQGGRSSEGALLLPSSSGRPDEIVMSESEATHAEKFSAFFLRQTGYVVCWQDPPPVGASLLAYAAAGRIVAADADVTTYFALPFANACSSYLRGLSEENADDAFEEALRDLSNTLGLGDHVIPKAILDRLLGTGSTLFILHADTLRPMPRRRSSSVVRLLDEAKSRGIRRDASHRCPPIVLVGCPKDENLTRRIAKYSDPSHDIPFGTKLGNKRSEFFERQWRRYCELRGRQLDAEAGSSRLKRVRHYYNSGAGVEAWPSTLRLHAFFASNYQTFGYFDPTAGWSRMAGMSLASLPLDIYLLLEEVVSKLRPIREQGQRLATLRAMRWCSTAVYWLTSAAVHDLGQSMSPRTPLARFQAAIAKDEKLVEVVHLDAERDIFKMDLATRAAIQDRWMRRAQLDRAGAHRQVALRLYGSYGDDDSLQAEFPREPHWGKSRIHFLVECIRHLVRTCEEAPRRTKPWPEEGTESFPDVPSSSWNGCDPYQVINFCFGEIYWHELNGNSRKKPMTNRTLALRHGAYHLTAEVLQLMSEGQQLGKPHWALNEAYVARYLREVGFAQLDLGDLLGAKETFTKLIDRERTAGRSPLDVIEYQLDLTVVLASMGDTRAAEDLLSTASAAFEELAAAGVGDARLSQQIQTRIRARQAHLAYLGERYEQALALCRHIEQTASAALVRDVAHIYISTLGAMNDRASLEQAVKLCVAQICENSSRTMHHEALGFRVALGHLFRKLKLLDAAEGAVDGAYEDILRYGCAERTYLAMLLEAGRIVEEQGRFVRAYAAYLRPCLDRAQSRGYARTADHAGDHARQCLLRMIESIPDSGWSREQIGQQLEGRGAYLQSERPEKIDPLYAYDPIAMERWLPRLQGREALLKELADIERG